MDSITFRAARSDEASLLSDLALRSKGHWGHGPDFLSACRAELTFQPGEVARRRFTVADSSGHLLGFYSIGGQPPDGELGNLWMIPELIGTGLGRQLWQHALSTASAAGFTSLRVEADPNAEGFYRAMGARRVSQAPSASVPGRFLPVLEMRLVPAAKTRPAP
ncbi:MAG: GNAT family N-acetyltransferase [Streptosporangiaceae bacterium]